MILTITQIVIDVTILSLIATASAHIVVKETSVSVPSLMQQLEVKKLVIAYVLINCDLGYEEYVIDALKNIEDVKEIQGTFGAYDIIAKVDNSKIDTLRETITWKIRKIDRIRSTLTLMGIGGQEFTR